MDMTSPDVVAHEIEASASAIARKVREGDFGSALEGLSILAGKVLVLLKRRARTVYEGALAA